VFFAGIETMYLPIAHAEGRIAVTGPAVLDQWERQGQVVLRYAPRQDLAVTNRPATVAMAAGSSVHASGNAGAADIDALLPFPVNPNGAVRNIAGLCDPTGRVCGLMPHPERHIDPTQHPRWTRRTVQPQAGDGLRVFQNAVEYFR
jgi:phosphoribosylformylglycinamidine synthase subunit PurQ / glutaminase